MKGAVFNRPFIFGSREEDLVSNIQEEKDGKK